LRRALAGPEACGGCAARRGSRQRKARGAWPW
jgi:hypothetical protein